MHEQMEELGKRHRRAFRAMFALIGAFLLMACLTAFVSTIRGRATSLRTTPDSAPAAARAAQTPEPATHGRSDRDSIAAPQPSSLPLRRRCSPSRAKSTPRDPCPPLAPPKLQSPQLAPAASAFASAPSATKPEPVASFGFLTIDTSPWSQVSVGGRVLGQTPLIGVRLPSGNQVLSLRNPELGIETSYPITIENGKTSVRRIGIE